MLQGSTIDGGKVADFARQFEDIARQRLLPEDLLPRQFYDGEVFLEELDLDAVDELARLAPFGPGKPAAGLFGARGPCAGGAAGWRKPPEVCSLSGGTTVYRVLLLAWGSCTINCLAHRIFFLRLSVMSGVGRYPCSCRCGTFVRPVLGDSVFRASV